MTQYSSTRSYGYQGAQASTHDVFIIKTYLHLFAAILAFTFIEIFFFTSGIAESIARQLLSVNWLFVLGGFIIASWIASHLAHSAQSRFVQYLALIGFVVAESIIFVPLLFVANHYAPGAISTAATVTLLGFSILTAVAFWTRKDFSFLRGVIIWGFGIALLSIIGGVIFGFPLGLGFSIIMVALAGCAILYDTSKIIHQFSEDRYVAAALELFASIALMFWYVLSIFLSFSRN